MISTSATLPTPLNADVVAFCPESGLHHVLACGCYELDNTQQPARRHGRLALAFVDRAGRQLVETSAVEGIGVLDCSWLQTSRLLLSAATAACDTRIYQVHKGADGTATLAEEACATMPCADAGDACMALDWSADASRVAVTSTAGRVYLGELGQSSGGCNGLRGSASWRAHELEGWAVAFDPRDSNTLYTGADDAQLKRCDLRPAAGGGEEPWRKPLGTFPSRWDLRAAADGGEPVATATNRRSHGAGVCCVSPSRLREHCVATGSHDERVARLLEEPSLKLRGTVL